MTKWILISGALLGATAVMTGAFGAHALKEVLDARSSEWYETAVSYHSSHALAVLLTGTVSLYATTRSPHRWIKLSAISLILGTLIFSGSLYTMAFTRLTQLGMITPIGGVFLILGWLCLAVAAFKLPSRVTAEN